MFEGRLSIWLWFTALIMFGVAGVLYYVGQQQSVVRDSMTLTAALMAGVGVLLCLWGLKWTRKGKQVARLKESGVPGQATITSMRQTGIYLNEQPQIELGLQITTSIHGTYQAKVKEFVPLMLLGTLTSGRPLPVMVDQADPTKFAIAWEQSLQPAAAMPSAVPAGAAPRYASDAAALAGSAAAAASVSKEQLLATGRDGEAKVISATPTGEVDASGNPVFDFVLEVDIPGSGRVQAPARAGVPADRIAHLAPGKTVPMKVDRNNPAAMAVDWNRI